MFRSTSDPDARHHHREPRRGPGPGDLPFGVRRMLGRGGWARGAVRRGEIRPLILAVLTEKPMHGYEVIQALETLSGGRWRPSAGSVYPTLQQLADEGLATSEEVDGRRTYTLTDRGRAAAASNPAPRPWNDASSDGEPDLRQLFHQVLEAVMQVQRVGTAQARDESIRILTDTRRQLYRLLAEDEAEPASGVGPDHSQP
jgi:DNA-binding PadR family transcriptional regulator